MWQLRTIAPIVESTGCLFRLARTLLRRGRPGEKPALSRADQAARVRGQFVEIVTV